MNAEFPRIMAKSQEQTNVMAQVIMATMALLKKETGIYKRTSTKTAGRR